METIILRPNKTREFRGLFVLLLFFAAGLWMVKTGKPSGWFAIALSSLCSLVFVLKIFPGSSFLRLDKNGFTEVCFFKRKTILWREVSEFFVCYGKVDYYWSESEIILSRTGGDGGLFDNYGLSPEKLAALLQEWKNKSQN